MMFMRIPLRWMNMLVTEIKLKFKSLSHNQMKHYQKFLKNEKLKKKRNSSRIRTKLWMKKMQPTLKKWLITNLLFLHLKKYKVK